MQERQALEVAGSRPRRLGATLYHSPKRVACTKLRHSTRIGSDEIAAPEDFVLTGSGKLSKGSPTFAEP
tara:strand:- start:973 stop:1179 length:207 start_codon:yes stop_codon:yes gene_type:complete